MTEGNRPGPASAPGMTLHIRESAARWWLRTEAAPGDLQLAQQLEGWLASDDRHRLAFTEIACVGGVLAQWPPAEAGTEAPARATTAVRGSAWRWTLQGIAVLILALAGWWWVPEWILAWRADVRTQVGEIRAQTLADGSVLTLDSDSAVAWHWQDERRDLTLLRGGLHVQVAKDPGRPLTVHSGALHVRAVGTAFSVDRERLAVQVDEGRVHLHFDGLPDTELVAGQGAQVQAAGWALRESAAQPPDWTHGQRIYQAVPLREVLDDLDRYLPQRVWLRDAAAMAQPVSAVLDLADPEKALRQLCAAQGLTVQHWPGVLMIGPQ